jgi:hypothetical protein
MIKQPVDFDPQEHLTLHPVVAKAGLNPAEHYLAHGRKEIPWNR